MLNSSVWMLFQRFQDSPRDGHERVEVLRRELKDLEQDDGGRVEFLKEVGTTRARRLGHDGPTLWRMMVRGRAEAVVKWAHLSSSLARKEYPVLAIAFYGEAWVGVPAACRSGRLRLI